MNKNIIKVTEGSTLRNDIPVVIGAITVSALISKGFIPEYDPNNDTGYQRSPQSGRIKELADAINNNSVDLPTALLLNIRRKKEDVIIRENGKMFLDLSKVKGKGIYIVDGQHRFLAVKSALENSPNDSFANYKIPFVSMLGANEYQEMEQFHIVNSKNRPVSTSLALQLLRKRAENNPDLLAALEEQDLDWKITGQEIVNLLSRNSKIWRDRIQLPNAKKGTTTIPSPSMITSFQPIIKSSRFFRQASLEQKIQLINAYWEGIALIIGEAFETGKDKGENGYDKFSIQKGVGVRGLHGIYPGALDLVRSAGASPFLAESFIPVLQGPIMGARGLNGNDELVEGIDFWRTGKKGCLAGFSSGVAIRNLITMLDKLLPKIDFPD